jgi:hypothetical protein
MDMEEILRQLSQLKLERDEENRKRDEENRKRDEENRNRDEAIERLREENLKEIERLREEHRKQVPKNENTRAHRNRDIETEGICESFLFSVVAALDVPLLFACRNRSLDYR